MQLKRDTDYALKILLNIAESINASENSEGVSLREISLNTKIPKQIAGRLCERLSEAGFIHECTEGGGGTGTYAADEVLPDVTLFDVVEAVEGTSEIFAVFDKNSELYRKYGSALDHTEGKIADELKKLSIGTILKIEHDRIPEKGSI